jgi:ribokinase
MNNANVVVVGSLNMDFIYRVQHLPAPGETLQALSFMRAAGGKGANQAVAAARQGARVRMIGCIGSDDIGIALVNGLAQDHVDTKHVHAIANTPTGMASIYVDDHAENNIVIIAGANALLQKQHIQSASNAISNAKCLLSQLETPLISFIEAARIAKQNGVIVIFNPSPVGDFDLQHLSLVDVLIVNEIEAKQLTGSSDITAAAKALLVFGPQHVIVSMGAKGVMLNSKSSEVFIQLPAFSVTPKDTTGAGDTFAGTLAAALAEGMEIQHAIERAQAAAAICVTRDGAQPSIPSRSDVNALLKKQNYSDQD